MKKVLTINELTGQRYEKELEDPTEWIELCINKNRWGKPARTIWEDEATEFELQRILTERIIEVEEFQEDGTEDNYFRTEIDLPADYVYTIVDVTAEVFEREALLKRKESYPDLGDFADAFFKHYRDNDSSVLNDWADNCQAVKVKYPKVKPAEVTK